MFGIPFAGLGVAHTDRSGVRDAYSDYWNSVGQDSDVLRENVSSPFSDFLGSLWQPFEDRILNSYSADRYRNFVASNPEIYQGIIDGEITFDSLLNGALAGLPNGNDNNAGSLSGYGLEPQTFEYLNAELAKFYGMDRNTAYMESLSNTAYQRSVKDMQAAGLNPAAIFGNGRGSTASGVSYAGAAGSASGFGNVSKSQLFDSDTYGVISSLAGLAAVTISKNPGNFWLGQQSAQAIMKTLNVLDSKYGK